MLLMVLLKRNLSIVSLRLTRSREAVVWRERIDALRVVRNTLRGQTVRVLAKLERVTGREESSHSR